jgi:hypothetical protein
VELNQNDDCRLTLVVDIPPFVINSALNLERRASNKRSQSFARQGRRARLRDGKQMTICGQQSPSVATQVVLLSPVFVDVPDPLLLLEYEATETGPEPPAIRWQEYGLTARETIISLTSLLCLPSEAALQRYLICKNRL